MEDRMMMYSAGIVITEMRYMQGMWEGEQSVPVTGGPAVQLGHVWPFLPMTPREMKFCRCRYCDACGLLVAMRSDRIPSEKIPASFRGA
jgi:hypothetical protein